MQNVFPMPKGLGVVREATLRFRIVQGYYSQAAQGLAG